MGVELDIDKSVLEALDFAIELPCEHSQHELKNATAPGEFIVDTGCPVCDGNSTMILCRECKDRLENSSLIHCVWCRHEEDTIWAFWKGIRRIK